jgi:signal-transduction protein with cAMP-binding, CBS, and nucleotidyltransferase domain
MAQTIREVMTPKPFALQATSTVLDAARTMREADIGDVLVLDDSAGVCGIVTDRDIVVRAVAEGLDAASVTLAEVCSSDVTTVDVDASVQETVDLMRTRALRRVPVIEGGAPVGIVSLGDLAIAQNPLSVLSDISEAPPNN